MVVQLSRFQLFGTRSGDFRFMIKLYRFPIFRFTVTRL